jgi:outer membrane receptor protein involved in Fe transport
VRGSSRFAHTGAIRLSPRAQVRHRTGPFTLTAALGRYARDLDAAEGIPRDLAPEQATHATLGGALELADGVSGSLAGFYTHREDLVIEDPSVTDPTQLPFKTGGTGRSTGFEALLRAHRGRFFGWLAYTFSRSTRHDAPEAPGRPFAFDQTHLVSAVGSSQRG